MNYKHGFGSTRNRLYRIWSNMKSRCYNPKASRYEHYGGKGITVCPEWHDNFQAFHDWAMSHGYQDDLSIDRIDNGKGYSPDNCRWETTKKQANNLSVNRQITFQGITKTLSEWAATTGINRRTIAARLDLRGWTVEQALTILVGKKVV